jgi:hypothetical protein
MGCLLHLLDSLFLCPEKLREAQTQQPCFFGSLPAYTEKAAASNDIFTLSGYGLDILPYIPHTSFPGMTSMVLNSANTLKA